MTRKIRLLHYSLALLVYITVLGLGLFASTPKEAVAFADLKEGNCAQCHGDGRTASGQSEQSEQPAETAQPAKPIEPSEWTKTTEPIVSAKPVEPAEPAEPEQPAKPTPNEVDNTLLGGGLLIAGLAISGAIWMDKRNKERRL